MPMTTLHMIVLIPKSLTMKACNQKHSEGSLACHTDCDLGHPFIMIISEDPLHVHPLSIVWQWSCHYLFSRFRSVCRGWDSNTQPSACRANALTHCATAAAVLILNVSMKVQNTWEHYIRTSAYSIRSLSTEAKTWNVPFVKRKTFASRSLVISRPTVWNKLPRNIRTINIFIIFKRQLKSFYFINAFKLLDIHAYIVLVLPMIIDI